MKRLSILALVVGGLSFAAVAHAEDIDNPQYTAWSKFAVGSSQTLDRTIKAGGQDVTITEARTLQSITPEAVTIDLEVTMAMNGMTMPPNSRPEIIKAKIDASQKPKELGEETVEAAGKSLKCKIYTMTINSSRGTGSDAKVWVSEEVPGGMVKTVATTPRGDATSILKKFEAK